MTTTKNKKMPRKPKSAPVTAETPLSIKERKYVAALIQGDSKQKAAMKAGAPNTVAADHWAHTTSKKVNVQHAIDQALEYHGATPEFAVGRLKMIAGQDDELGAARLASKDILELHGWRRGERPVVSLTFSGNFYGRTREPKHVPTDVLENDG